MPSLAADLLEAGFNTPSLKRLAGENPVHCKADVNELVCKMFCELDVRFPISDTEAKHYFTRQIAREVIAGERNAWGAASHLEIVVWGWEADGSDLADLFRMNDEIDRDTPYRRPLSTLNTALIETFARLGARTDCEKRMASLGALEGKGWIAEDFDAPLPNEIQALVEGCDKWIPL
jgi:hypothetical protein